MTSILTTNQTNLTNGEKLQRQSDRHHPLPSIRPNWKNGFEQKGTKSAKKVTAAQLTSKVR